MNSAVLFWIVGCAVLNLVGWFLSALGQLNAAGYAGFFAITATAGIIWWRKTARRLPLRGFRWRKAKRRFSRLFPAAFLVLSGLVLAGGILYPPSNWDALAYRVPRVLHWLAAGHWEWIHTVFPRVNVRGCGIEWVSAPVIALFKTDRPLFVINLISFFLLPGLIFAAFREMGVRPRVAWYWMWILPTAYCFLLQAGGIGNDLYGVPFALAAVGFALRARKSGKLRDVFASILAIALLTSSKLNTLPLGLPWAIAIFPSLRLLLRRPAAAVAIGVLAFFASALPTLVLNMRHCGDWSGRSEEDTMLKRDPVVRLEANLLLLGLQNLAPPVCPFGEAWSASIRNSLPAKFKSNLSDNMEPEVLNLRIPELQIEENAGLGFGICVALAISAIAAAFQNRGRPAASTGADRASPWLRSVRLSGWIAVLALLTQSGFVPVARLVASYYPLLLPTFLAARGHDRLIRHRWWRGMMFLVVCLAGVALVALPARPLFPAQALSQWLQRRFPQSTASARIQRVYQVYRDRNDGLAALRAALPPGTQTIGLITFDDLETSLWRPFGSRRIRHVRPEDSAEDLKRSGIEYVFVRKELLPCWFHCSADEWLDRIHGKTVAVCSVDVRAGTGKTEFYLIQLL